MSPSLLEFIGVVLAVFLGAILSHYFTLWKYQKDILYQKKVDSYVELSRSIVAFESLCLPTNPPSTIIMSYKHMLDNIQQAYLFMPDPILKYIKSVLGDPFVAFKNITKLDDESCNYYFSYNVSGKLDTGIANPTISLAMVKVFNPFLSKVPEIGKKLKEDIGTVKVGIHFFK